MFYPNDKIITGMGSSVGLFEWLLILDGVTQNFSDTVCFTLLPEADFRPSTMEQGLGLA